MTHKRSYNISRKIYECDICPKKYTWTKSLNRHKKIHVTKPIKRIVSDTDSSDTNPSAMKKSKPNENQYESDGKAYVFKSYNEGYVSPQETDNSSDEDWSSEIDRLPLPHPHQIKKRGKKRIRMKYKCSTCNNRFRTASVLRIHTNRHKGIKP